MPQKVPFFIFKRRFSTSQARRATVWPGTYISIAVIARVFALGIGTITSLAAMGIFLSSGFNQGLEQEFVDTLDIFIRGINHITTTMLNRLTHTYTEQDLRAFLEMLTGIIPILQQILEVINGVLEDIDTMSELYDVIFNNATQLQSYIRSLLFVYRRMEAELGISAQETDLVPGPEEEDFYAEYVLALTGQGA